MSRHNKRDNIKLINDFKYKEKVGIFYKMEERNMMKFIIINCDENQSYVKSFLRCMGVRKELEVPFIIVGKKGFTTRNYSGLYQLLSRSVKRETCDTIFDQIKEFRPNHFPN